MGAGASVPDELTLEEARQLAGDKWDDKLLTFWPTGEEKITKEKLLDIVQNIPMFSKRPDVETQLDWDNTPVGPSAPSAPSATPEQPDALPEEAHQAPVQQREKVEVAAREKLDTEKIRMQKVAEQNGVTVEEIMKIKAQNNKKLPPRPKQKKVGQKQSAELRALVRDQKKAARAEGRPPSRGLDEMELQLVLGPEKKEGGQPQAEPEIMIL